ncbi:hypothetical protein BDR03DRAFT_987731 [Suillus americanus]|nr:hypothetical protein BDR03DRAFT_987731 [Suillus americanus]
MSDFEDDIVDSDDDLGTITFQGVARNIDHDESRPFDLADVPSSVEAEDALPQSEVLESLFLQQEGPQRAGRTWEQTKVQPINLSTLARNFKKDDKATAINLLHRRSVLRLDDDLYYSSDDEMLAWDGSKHFLDFCLVVGGQPGLHALLPNKVIDHTFSLALNLCLPTRLFRPKFGKLGFDPTGCMMALGTAPSSELWLAFCPRENLEDADVANEAPLLSDKQHGDTRLSSSHFRMAVMFLAHALSKNPDMPIYCMEDQRCVEHIKQCIRQSGLQCAALATVATAAGWNQSDKTTISSYPFGFASRVHDGGIQQTSWDLRLDDLVALHNTIVSDWDEWVAAAPRSWKEDGWLLSRMPVAITCRYGQNQPIANLNARANTEEGKIWNTERSYTNIRYVSIAIATDIKCVRVKRWTEVPNQDIIDEHGVIYDSPDKNIREEVDLNHLPHRDPVTRRENNVYDEDGRRIPRLHGKTRTNAKPCGLLINLETISDLFTSYIPAYEDMTIDADAFQGEEISAPSVSVFPQAFLRTMGHIQCDAVLPHFAPFISDIRRSTTRRPRTVNLDDDEPIPDEYDLFGERLDDDQHRIPPVLIPSACQFYNEISHRIRPSAALHEVQQGRITSALAGAYGNAATKITHDARMRECKMSLPHQKYDNKISLDDVPRDLRLENIYIIQCESLRPEKRNGMSIYKDIIVPLARAWSHPNIFQALRPHICVFASHIYQWTAFGITSLLERLWAYQLPIIEAGNKPRHEAVELCSVLERTLAYAHTGNARVLATRLMRPLWLVQSLLEQGLPTFAPSIRTTTAINNPIAISASDWPTSDNLNVPAIASKRSQVLTYGSDHFEAYKAGFHIELSINKLSPHIFLQYTTEERHCIVIALVALRSYVADVKALVATAVKKECSSNGTDVDDIGPSRDKDRLKSLQKWLACEHPLGYKDKAYEHLLRCVVVDPNNYSDGLPNASKDKLSVQDFAVRISQMTRIDNPISVAAPLIFTAPSTAVFRTAYSRMLKYAPANSPASADKCIQRAYIIAANHLQIQHVPWHVPHTSTRGRQSRKAVHNSWVNLGKSFVGDQSATAGRSNPRPIDMAAEAAKIAQASDARAPWAVESITLQSLPDFFARDSLPDEFGLHNIDCAGDPLLVEIYEWAFANFNRDKPMHKIALLAGIYISHALPDIFWDPKDKPLYTKMLSEQASTAAVRVLPWKPNKSSRKGCSWRPTFISMVPAYIISVYERASPLRDYFKDKKAFPTQWNSKNSAKGIGSLNLVRMGLAKARSGRIFKGGAPLADWVLLTNEEVAAKHQELMGHLQDRQYGPFKIAVAFFGLEKAVEIGVTTGTYTTHPAMSAIASTKKKRMMPEPDSDDEVEIIEHEQQYKRHRY